VVCVIHQVSLVGSCDSPGVASGSCDLPGVPSGLSDSLGVASGFM